MKAVVAREPGGPEVLELVDVPDIEPKPGEVLIEVAAAGVNRADLLQRRGFYPPPKDAPEWLGLECSGTIVAVGQGVVSRSVGDEVCALLSGGGYAERVSVPTGQVMDIPAGVDLVTAAALPEAAATVWSNIVMTAGLREGESLLIHGGGSGIGTMGIQIARALGARVFVTAGSAAKLSRCEELGAEVLINYREQDFVEVIRDETGGRGVDVILDNMGASYLARNISALAFGGRLAIIGLQGGTKSEINLGAVLSTNVTISALSLRARPSDQKAMICKELERRVWPLIAAGLVKPTVDRVLSLADAPAAHAALDDGSVVGKILLRP